jgi:hypothetical protein
VNLESNLAFSGHVRRGGPGQAAPRPCAKFRDWPPPTVPATTTGRCTAVIAVAQLTQWRPVWLGAAVLCGRPIRADVRPLASRTREFKCRTLRLGSDRPHGSQGSITSAPSSPASSFFIYSALLPGITNVTDRAWLFGFYPWFIRAFERRRPDASEAEFRDWLRRADCLATLIGTRHAIVQGEDGRDDGRHGQAFPGRLRLVRAARSLSQGGSLLLSTYTEPSDGNELR